MPAMGFCPGNDRSHFTVLLIATEPTCICWWTTPHQQLGDLGLTIFGPDETQSMKNYVSLFHEQQVTSTQDLEAPIDTPFIWCFQWITRTVSSQVWYCNMWASSAEYETGYFYLNIFDTSDISVYATCPSSSRTRDLSNSLTSFSCIANVPHI